MLSIVAYQLSLFKWRPVAESRSMGNERDGRTGDQWLRSISAYCEWRAGECWRNLSRPEHRDSAERREYLAAIRLLSTVRYAEPQRPSLVLPALNVSPAPSRAEITLALKPRTWLVEQLMRVDPTLTDKRLLSHLPRPKLAHMLSSARAVAPGQMERTA